MTAAIGTCGGANRRCVSLIATSWVLVSVLGIKAGDLVGERSMQCMHHRCRDPIPHRHRTEPGVVVNDVEGLAAVCCLFYLGKHTGHVIGFVKRSADLPRMTIRQNLPYPSRGARTGCSKQGDVVPAVNESLTQQPNDQLNAAIAGRRHRNPRRRQHRDLVPGATVAAMTLTAGHGLAGQLGSLRWDERA